MLNGKSELAGGTNESSQYSFDSLWFSNNCRKSLGACHKFFDNAVHTVSWTAISNRWNLRPSYSKEQTDKGIIHQAIVSH
jgi:hypothetical protein